MRTVVFVCVASLASGGCQTGVYRPPPSSDVDPVRSSIFVDRPSGVVADGLDRAAVTVLVRSESWEPLAGVSVALAVDGVEAMVTQPEEVSDPLGRVVGAVAATVAGPVSITATVDPDDAAVQLASAAKVEFVWPPGPRPPRLEPLRLARVTSTALVLERPALLDPGEPAATVEAWVGLDGTIAVTGTAVTNAIEGPVDVGTVGYSFLGLASTTSHRLVVVAQNSSGFAVEQLEATTYDDPYVEAGVNEGCTKDAPDRLWCPLTLGSSEVAVRVDAEGAEHVALVNQTGAPLQIDQIDTTTVSGGAGRVCAYRGELRAGQSPAGAGEVGCVSRIDTPFAPLRWREAAGSTGLILAPGEGEELLLAASMAVTEEEIVRFDVLTTLATDGVSVLRQPKDGDPIGCAPSAETVFEPWRNDSEQTWSIHGATIDASTPDALTVDSACLVVLDELDRPVSSDCSGLESQGWVAFEPPVEVPPGHGVDAAAAHACTAGSWLWAAYLWVDDVAL